MHLGNRKLGQANLHALLQILAHDVFPAVLLEHLDIHVWQLLDEEAVGRQQTFVEFRAELMLHHLDVDLNLAVMVHVDADVAMHAMLLLANLHTRRPLHTRDKHVVRHIVDVVIVLWPEFEDARERLVLV